jgi:4-amino-4-deoxychorismate lyase
MSRLFESIRIVDGSAQHLDYHNARLNCSRRELFGCTDVIELKDIIHIPRDLGRDVHKCRVIYAQGIEQIEFVPYQRRDIKTLTLVECDSIEYAHKFVDRECIESLFKDVRTDDILIVKHSRVTDASFANVIFHDGAKWLTPSTPLLSGTARARLLETGTIIADEIRKTDLRHFKKAALINAMTGLEDAVPLGMDSIF